MTEPSVACICLTRDRSEMTKRAIRSFQAQAYGRKRLIIFDSSEQFDEELYAFDRDSNGIAYCHFPEAAKLSFGALRNAANAHECSELDILIHFDSDDVSHPARIAEQATFLQESGADAVGYNEMLFWRSIDPTGDDWRNRAQRGEIIDVTSRPGEAWLYRNGNPGYFLDTSACYWRRTWERQPFPNMAAGADTVWLTQLQHARMKTRGKSSHVPLRAETYMIATIHGGNMSSRIDAGKREWARAPQWDDYCRRTLAMEAEFVPVAGNPDERGNEI